MTTKWESQLVADIVKTNFVPKSSSSSLNSPPKASINVLITFDANGVSSHPNHVSLYHGARRFLQEVMHRRDGWACPIALYTLTTTNMVRKYMTLLDAPMSILSCVFRKKEAGESPSPLLFVSSPSGYRSAQRAMTAAHQSQMRWFRWGWISVSRYMIINDLKKVKVL